MGEGGTEHWSWIVATGELEGELVWGVSECCSKFRIDRTVGESKDADVVGGPAWYRDGVSPSATTAVGCLAEGLILVLRSARALLRRGRVVTCGVVTLEE